MPLSGSTAFERVHVDYAIKGTARISWDLRRNFNPARNLLVFQLQANKAGGDPEAWVNVGLPVENSNFALDDQQRQFSKELRIVYRVKLTVCNDEYYSGIATPLGDLTMKQWLQARAIMRKLQLRPRGSRTLSGYLLKRKLYGAACPACTDKLTRGIGNSHCAQCFGTGYVQGYWKAAENTLFDCTPDRRQTVRDPQLARGTVNDVAVASGMMLGLPRVDTGDVWVDRASDRRYYIGQIQHVAEIARVPLVISVELRLAPFSDVVYDVPITGT